MSTLTKEKLARLVKCVLCMKTFTSPQIMKCLHTFCKHCLENHAKCSSVDDVQGLECPRCKEFTAQGDVTVCARIEKLLTLHERVIKPKVCIQCETEAAEWKCYECDELYCKHCKSEHDKFKALQRHQWSELSDLNDSLLLESSVLCASHKTKEADCFCFDCDVLLCSLCLLQGHDGHKRDTVHNATGHVKSKVDEKLAAVKQICNERFLRAGKLKDTRLCIQTYADESFDAIKSRYEFMKKKLEDDYQSLTQELKSLVDAEVDKVNVAIGAEEAKQSHAASVTSYVENTLAATSDGMFIQESIQQLIPTMQQFCDVESFTQLQVLTSFYRFKTAESVQDFDNNLIGEIETVEANFYGRYQPAIERKQLENAREGKTIDVNLAREAKGYRINVGFGQILVCLWSINTILVYSSDGTEMQRLDLSGKLKNPSSAVFVDASHVMTAAENGLALVNLTTSGVVSITQDEYSDVCLCGNTICALNVETNHVDLVRKNGRDWRVSESISMANFDLVIHVSSTAIALTNSFYFFNRKNKVLQFGLSGELLQTVMLPEHEPASTSRRICAVDADGRMLLRVNGQLVLQHNDQNQVVKLKGLTRVTDIVFEDQYTFWILNIVSIDRGRYKLVKYTI